MRTLVFLLLVTPAFAQKHADTPKEKDIRKLLQLSGGEQLGDQLKHQLLDTFKSSMPNVPPSVWMEIQQDLNANEVIEKVIPIWDKQFSAAEIKDLIQFYESPTGKKLVRVMPAITQETMVVGQEWGRAMSDKVVALLKKKGAKKK